MPVTGFILKVVVHSAAIQDRDGAKRLLLALWHNMKLRTRLAES